MGGFDYRTQERIKHLTIDSLWKGRPIWILSYYRLKRDANGTVLETARLNFEKYLLEEQEHFEKVTALASFHVSHKTQKSAWFSAARLISLNAYNVFRTTQGDWDTVVLFEYPSPEDFLRQIVDSQDYQRLSQILYSVIDKSMKVAIKPTHLVYDSKLSLEQLQSCQEYADNVWKKLKEGKLDDQTGEESQDIYPDVESLVKFLKQQRFSTRMFALNLLQYRRSEKEPHGRNKYFQYGAGVQVVMEKHISEPKGLRASSTPCKTIEGDIEWDEFVIMQYPNLMGFLKFTSLKEYQDLHIYRDEGLLAQGLVFIEPQIVNGVVVSEKLRMKMNGLDKAASTFQSKL